MENHKSANLELPEIVLASGSPRRSEILQSVGWNFQKIVPDIDESEIPGESPEQYVLRLAETKAAAVVAPGKLVLGADTTVVVDGSIVGKPADLEDARRMITSLSGRWHEVLTGVALVHSERTVSSVQKTRVRFSGLMRDEIDFLVNLGSPLDKAGGYAVQAQAALFIEEIKGDYWNIVGLPVSLVYRLYRSLANQK